MIINQPRLDSISEYEVSVKDLLDWGETVVKPKALMAIKGEGEAHPGDWCRFCKRDPPLLEDGEISDILGRAARIQNWISDVKDYAQEEAEKGRQWPGWKLVEGRSNRKYSDPQEVEKRLLAAGFEKVLLYKDPELLGITAMEKVVGGKKKLETLIAGLIVKPPGAPTLVPESDKRPALNTAKEDFKED